MKDVSASPEGFLTIAYGAEKYIRMAKGLALSYRRLRGTRPFAVVTDEKNSAELSKYFDRIMIVNHQYGSGVVQKLHVDLYSPWSRSLFIDSDCIFYKDPELVWNLYSGKAFSVRGWRYLNGHTTYEQQRPYEWLSSVESFLKAMGIERLPHFNSGIFYFDASNEAQEVFEMARDIYRRRDELGFVKFKNAPVADEPALAGAMEKCGIEMDEWDSVNGMETAIHMQENHGINVLTGNSRFTKAGTLREPAVIHYNVNAQRSKVYQTDLQRLFFENGSVPTTFSGPVASLHVMRAFSERLLKVARGR